MAKIHEIAPGVWVFHCPACRFDHPYHVAPQRRENRADGSEAPLWEWNESVDAPTFTPSLKVYLMHEKICHLHMVDGKIHFCADSDHAMAGQVVDCPEWE